MGDVEGIDEGWPELVGSLDGSSVGDDDGLSEGDADGVLVGSCGIIQEGAVF